MISSEDVFLGLLLLALFELILRALHNLFRVSRVEDFGIGFQAAGHANSLTQNQKTQTRAPKPGIQTREGAPNPKP